MKLITQIILIFVIAFIVPVILAALVVTGYLKFPVFVLGTLILMLLAFIWFEESLIKPLSELKKGTARIRDGDLDFTLETDSDGEVGELVRSFEEMRVRLKDSQNENVRSDMETKELIRNIAHDLKTPITTIRGYSEGLLDGIASTPEKQHKYLHTIFNKANDMTSLIDELSFYAKIDSNRIPYNFKKIVAKEFFDTCAEDIGLDMDGKGINFTYEQNLGEDVQIAADPEQVRKVVNNIISNSVKYIDKPEKKIWMTITDVGDFVQCDIRDNGIGVLAEDLPKLYDRFFRTDKSRNTAAGGSGIGLSIARKIIEDHGGKIWASCEPGQGLEQHFILRKI